jgi:hypothetical protein
MGSGERRVIGTILLMFSMNDLPLQVCADFVETLAGMPVIENDYSFKFQSIEPTDGSVHTFSGQCIVEQDLKSENKD